MTATARQAKGTRSQSALHLAFELGRQHWKLGFSTGLGRKPRYRTIQARDLETLEEEIEATRRRFDLPEDAPVVSCYEAGRDGFWLHRFLLDRGVKNHVVDSSSIEVPRRARRRKTDKLDLKSLLRLLIRYWTLGEEDAWSVVNAPSRAAEDRRQLHRELETLKAERTARGNRIRSLLATQGLKLELRPGFPERLREARLWDGSPVPRDLRARLEREWTRRETVSEEIRALNKERRRRLREAKDDPALEQVRQMIKLRGVALKSAWLFAMEWFSWRDFQNRREIGGLSGLVDAPDDSASSSRSQGMEKAGNERVRTMAIEVAWNWIRLQPESKITRWFEERYADAGPKARKCGIGGVARRLLIALWRYLEFGEIPEGAVLNG